MAGAAWLVEPAQRVGQFVLGMGVNEALAFVRKTGTLEGAEFHFDEMRPFDADLSLRMPALGLQLCFDGLQQDLRVISVCLRQRPQSESVTLGAAPPSLGAAPSAPSSLPAGDPGGGCAEVGTSQGGDCDAAEPTMLPPLAYGGQIFAGIRRPALALRDVYAMFGPTWIGDFRRADPAANRPAAYFLRYPGLTFEFPLPEDLVEDLAARGEHPMELPDRPPPTAARMWVFAQEAGSFIEPASAVPDAPEGAVVRPAAGVELRGRVLRFGSMPQDVFSDFGPPEQVCVKEVDAVRIHSARTLPSRLSGLDYYYNYFHLGLDVLFDGCTHMVKKVILHTNPPTHELFAEYARCFFRIPIDTDALEPLSTAFPPGGRGPGGNALDSVLLGAASGTAGGAAVRSAMIPLSMPPAAVPIDELPPEPGEGAPASGVRADGVVSKGASATGAQGSADASDAEAVAGETAAAPAEVAAVDATAEEAAGEDATVAEDAEDAEEFRLAGRRMTKKERKAQRKGRKGAARAAAEAAAEAAEAVEAEPTEAPGASESPSPAASPGASPLMPPQAAPCQDAALETMRGAPATPILAALCEAGAPADGGEVEPDTFTQTRFGGAFAGSAEQRASALAMGTDAGCGACIDVQWTWSEIQEVLSRSPGCACGKPLIMSQSGHTPFGSTHFYALPGLAFEVMQNGFVASLTVFAVPPDEIPPLFAPRPPASSQAAAAAAATAGGGIGVDTGVA